MKAAIVSGIYSKSPVTPIAPNYPTGERIWPATTLFAVCGKCRPVNYSSTYKMQDTKVPKYGNLTTAGNVTFTVRSNTWELGGVMYSAI